MSGTDVVIKMTKCLAFKKITKKNKSVQLYYYMDAIVTKIYMFK